MYSNKDLFASLSDEMDLKKPLFMWDASKFI